MSKHTWLTITNVFVFGFVLMVWLAHSEELSLHVKSAIQQIQLCVEAILITAFFSILQLFIMTSAIIAGNESKEEGE